MSKPAKRQKETTSQVSESSVLGYRAKKIGIIEKLEKKQDNAELISQVIELSGLNIKTLATYVYEMTPKTLTSYRQKGKAIPSRSVEISIKLKELYTKGTELFGSNENFNSWLQKESYGLGNRMPLRLLNTSSGIDLVYEELLRMEFGATA